MPRKIIALCGLIALLLAACNTATPTPTQNPLPVADSSATEPPQPATASPTATRGMPTPSATLPFTPTLSAFFPTATHSPSAHSGSTTLGSTLWLWTETSRGNGSTQKVDNPLRYSLVFTSNGEINILADCNLFRGTYQVDPAGALTHLEIGEGTKMACPPDSQSGDFLQQLSQVSHGFLQDGSLFLELADGATRIQLTPNLLLSYPSPPADAAHIITTQNVFVRSGPDTRFAPLGVLPAGAKVEIIGKFTPWWAVRLPGMPGGRGWVSQSSVKAEHYLNVPSLPPLPEDYGRTYYLPALDEPQIILTEATLIRAAPDTPENPGQPALLAGLPGGNFFVLGRDPDAKNWLVFLPSEIAPAGMGWVPASHAHALNADNVPIIHHPPYLKNYLPFPITANDPVASPRATIYYRAGPGLEYDALSFALKGQILPVLGQSADGAWLQVRVGASVSPDGKAWVAAPNVYLFNAEKVLVVPTPLPAWVPSNVNANSCAIQFQSPVNGKAFRPYQDFTFTIELLNHTSKTWSHDSTDIAFIAPLGGEPLHTGPDLYDLDHSVLPGGTYRFSFQASSRRTSGEVGEVWAVLRGSEVICSFTYRIYLAPTPQPPTSTPWPTQTGTIEPTPPPDVPPTPTVGTPEPTNPPEVTPTPRW